MASMARKPKLSSKLEELFSQVDNFLHHAEEKFGSNEEVRAVVYDIRNLMNTVRASVQNQEEKEEVLQALRTIQEHLRNITEPVTGEDLTHLKKHLLQMSSLYP